MIKYMLLLLKKGKCIFLTSRMHLKHIMFNEVSTLKSLNHSTFDCKITLFKNPLNHTYKLKNNTKKNTYQESPARIKRLLIFHVFLYYRFFTFLNIILQSNVL